LPGQAGAAKVIAMPDADWNERYVAGTLPWDTGRPADHLIELVEAGAVPDGSALEVGCGTGTNALWLAARGYDVVAVDVAPVAIEQARARAGDAAGVRFEVVDFLAADPPGAPFDLVFDRGCFHVFDDAEVRARFAARVAAALAPGGMWLSLIGSTEGGPRDVGPPRRTARDVMAALEPALELVTLRAITFDGPEEIRARAWLCLSRRREVAAQPSTRR
jgi:methyl halide transferase